jgi:ZIP family zinc transporter
MRYATFAFLAGVILVLLLDRFVPNPHTMVEKSANLQLDQAQIRRTALLTLLAITAHNSS